MKRGMGTVKDDRMDESRGGIDGGEDETVRPITKGNRGKRFVPCCREIPEPGEQREEKRVIRKLYNSWGGPGHGLGKGSVIEAKRTTSNISSLHLPE